MGIRQVIGSGIGRLILVTSIALVAVLIVYIVPLSTERIRIVKYFDTPVEISLHAGDHLQQKVHLTEGVYSGVAVFSNTSTLSGRVVRVVITDPKGSIVARGDADTVSYLSSANVSRIQMDTSWWRVSHEGAYLLDISFLHGDPLSLLMMERDKNLSAAQKLSINGQPQSAIISLTFMRRVPTDFGARQGVIVGAIAMIGIALISLLKTSKQKMIGAIVGIVFLAPLGNLGYLFPTGDLGIADWDLYVPLHDSYRKAILQLHTFPFWDPYPCGGTAGLGDPEFPVFTPTFLLVLLFGSSWGLRLDVVLSVIVGAIGMLVLARKLGRSVEAGLLAALIVSFGGVNLIENVEGHVNILTVMWIPWIFWAWLCVYQKKMRPIILGIFLALTFLGGGVYLLIYTTIAFIVLTLLASRKKDAFLTALKSGLWGLGLVSFKLIPVIYWLKQFTDRVYVPSSYTLPWLGDIFFGRYLHDTYVILNQSSGWHEYGAYIGYGALVLALIGSARFFQNRIIRALSIATILAIALSTLGPFLAPILDHIKFLPRSNLSRVIVFAVIPIALLASYGMDRLRNFMPKYGNVIQVCVIGFIAIDLISLTYQISEQAFVLPHVIPLISPAPYPIAYTPERYDDAGQGSRTTRTTDAYFAGYGTEAYCSVLGPQSAVRTIYDEGDTGAVSALDSRAKVTIVFWSYNTVKVHVDTPIATRVVLNENYAKGWMANGKPAIIESNRPAIDISEGSYDIVFQYKAPGFFIGLFITILIISIACYSSFARPDSRRKK
ncbi:MAG: hypothetical protein K8Q97_01320 [Candidatus Andersenbacteria bacterium]|nr:hypothetical protein [Candidatus Andersenbacteria bacterium]